MGFKPIFEEERRFLLDKTGVDLPTDCWRNSSKIYLDFTQPAPYIQFKVADGEIIIVKNNADGYKIGNKMNFLFIRPIFCHIQGRILFLCHTCYNSKQSF